MNPDGVRDLDLLIPPCVGGLGGVRFGARRDALRGRGGRGAGTPCRAGTPVPSRQPVPRRTPGVRAGPGRRRGPTDGLRCGRCSSVSRAPRCASTARRGGDRARPPRPPRRGAGRRRRDRPRAGPPRGGAADPRGPGRADEPRPRRRRRLGPGRQPVHALRGHASRPAAGLHRSRGARPTPAAIYDAASAPRSRSWGSPPSAAGSVPRWRWSWSTTARSRIWLDTAER